MKQFLDGKFAPVTFSVGFLEKPLGIVADACLSWTKKNRKVVEMYPVEDEFPSAILRLSPFAPIPRRGLFLATDSTWTAYFDNCERGPDLFSTISYLAEQVHCRGLIATNIPNILDTATGLRRGSYGAVAFKLFAPTTREFLNYERAVTAMNDGGKWKFIENWNVQPFEEVERYSAPKIADRFTPDMLERYCAALGVRVFDESFYKSAGVLVDIKDPLPEGMREITLAEARQKLAIG